MTNASTRGAEKKYCACCQQFVSSSTEYRHRRLQAPPRLKASSPFLRDDAVVRPWPSEGRSSQQRPTPVDIEMCTQNPGDPVLAYDCETTDGESATRPAIVQDAMSKQSEGWTQSLSVEEAEGDEGGASASSEESDEEDEGRASASSEESDGGSTRISTGLDICDQVGEGFERDLVSIGEL